MKKIYSLIFSSVIALSAFAGTYDLELSSLNIQSASVINNDVIISGTVTNTGSETIHSFIVNWSDGISNHETTISGLNITPGETYTFSHPTHFTPTVAKKYAITVEIKSLDGMVENTLANNQLSQNVHGTTREAVKRVVAEEATGTWCGWCVRGIVYMDQMRDDYGDTFIGIAVHNSDPMEVSSYDSDLGDIISGYPTVVLDREQVIDPSAMPTKVPGRLDNDPVVDINVHGNYDDASGVLHATITVSFLSADDGLDYRFNAILTEDGVTGTSSGYAQANYYSGGGYGAMGGFEDLPYTVPASDMVYDFVARATGEDWAGTGDIIPSVVNAGDYYTAEYEFDIDNDWDINQMHVIGILSDHDNDDEIINANSVRLTDITAGAEDIANKFDIDVYPNPANVHTNITIDLPVATELSMSITDINGKVIAQRSYGMQNGQIAMPVNSGNFASGIYFVNVIAGSQVITEKLNVVH